ncbi:hypothetical protein T05_7640, partial [Trichinella murrelli]
LCLYHTEFRKQPPRTVFTLCDRLVICTSLVARCCFPCLTR